MKEVTFLINTLDSGGIENYLLRFLQYYNGEIKPIVICKGGAFGDLESEYRKIKHIKLLKKNIGFFSLTSYWDLFKYFKNNRVNIVCDFTGNFAGIVVLMARLGRVQRRVAFYRGSTDRFSPSILRNMYNKFCNLLVRNNSTLILSNSKFALLNYFGVENFENNSKYDVVNNGIDFEKFISLDTVINRKMFDIPDNAYVIGHTGRYTTAKNHKVIIEVFSNLVNENNNIYLILCGKGTKEIILNTKLLKERVKVLGYRTDVPSILNLMDLYFFPSLTEGQPNALIEAMIMGLPFIASDISSIKETVPEDQYQYLFDPNDVIGFSDGVKRKIAEGSSKQNDEISNWAKGKFNHNTLFKKFFDYL